MRDAAVALASAPSAATPSGGPSDSLGRPPVRAAAVKCCEVCAVAALTSPLTNDAAAAPGLQAGQVGLHPLTLDKEAKQGGEEMLGKLEAWAADPQGKAGSKAGKAGAEWGAAERCCLASGLCSVALASPPHFPRAARALLNLLDQPASRASPAQAAASAAAHKTAQATARSCALLLVRFGKAGVGSLRLTPVAEQARFQSVDALAAALAKLGLAAQVKSLGLLATQVKSLGLTAQ